MCQSPVVRATVRLGGGEHREGGGKGIYDEAGRQLKAEQDRALAALVSRFFDP